MEIEESAGAVVFRNSFGNVEFLIIQSKENGHWGFPKGHRKKGESLEETVLREVLEETGLDIEFINNFEQKIAYQLTNSIKKEVTFFLGFSKDNSIEIQEEEIEDFKWGNYEEIREKITFENSKQILMEAKKFMEDNKINLI